MKTGFINQTLDVRTGNGLDDVLLESLDFVRANGDILRAPIGGTTDGLSVPRCLQNIIPATGGDWFSAVLHDSGYRDQLLMIPECAVPDDGDLDKVIFQPANFDQKQCDDMILEALLAQDVSEFDAHIIYNALRLFGSVAFNDDRKAAKPAD